MSVLWSYDLKSCPALLNQQIQIMSHEHARSLARENLACKYPAVV